MWSKHRLRVTSAIQPLSAASSRSVSSDPGRPVEVEDVELAQPGPGEVRVRIAAAGVCHSDLHVRRGEWDVAAPLVMGHEGSGTVVATGTGVEGVREGDHVVLSWVP